MSANRIQNRKVNGNYDMRCRACPGWRVKNSPPDEARQAWAEHQGSASHQRHTGRAVRSAVDAAANVFGPDAHP